MADWHQLTHSNFELATRNTRKLSPMIQLQQLHKRFADRVLLDSRHVAGR